jgi:hypothetical protein
MGLWAGSWVKAQERKAAREKTCLGKKEKLQETYETNSNAALLFFLHSSSKTCLRNKPSLQTGPDRRRRAYGSRSCSDAVVGRRAAASELFLTLFEDFFMPIRFCSSPLLNSQINFRKTTS